jgi:radical SAM protein with 4Fe4S-binding SPASM domain
MPDYLKKFTDSSYFIREFEVDPGWNIDFGDDYNQYRTRWENASKNFHLYDFPLCLEVETSYACNFKCPNCPRFVSDIPLKGIMPTNVFQRIIAESQDMKLDSIFLDHGGEPLLNKNLPEFVKISAVAGIKDIMLSTNGSLLTRDISSQLISNGLTKINFSIDACSKKIYSRVRPGGSYSQTIENIFTFLEEKKKHGKSFPRVRVSFIVQDDNRHEMEDFFNFWQNKVNVIAFQQLKHYNNTWEEPDVTAFQDYEYQCPQIFTTLMLEQSGGIHICNHDYNHEHCLGNIKDISIRDCWHSKILKQLRELHLKKKWAEHKFCRRCVLRSL